jgi:hypothetical protein
MDVKNVIRKSPALGFTDHGRDIMALDGSDNQSIKYIIHSAATAKVIHWLSQALQ